MSVVIGAEITLPPLRRGVHLIDRELRRALDVRSIGIGLLHVHCLHTSASLALNENADPTVRADVESWLNRQAPEREPWYRHTYEGDDDMPAHLKSIMTGSSVTIPLRQGAWALGTWQGVYLCEHRDHGGARRLVLTAMGSPQ
jgi:secondary thiamine-phosphate synthase enzyme